MDTARKAHDQATSPFPLPEGYASVMPWIITPDTAAFLEFAKEAFLAEEIARQTAEDGSIAHAEAIINGTVILMFDSPHAQPHPIFLRLTVSDAHSAFDRAIAAGATPITEVTYLYWGDEIGRVRDPFGNVWWLQAHARDVPPDELEARAEDPENVEAMAYVQESLLGAFAGSRS